MREENMMSIEQTSRRDLLRKAMIGAAAGAAALALPNTARASALHDDEDSEDVAAIHQLQADFHRAKSTQNIDLMMSLWADDAVFVVNGATFAGSAAIKALFLGSGSFTHLRLSLVSSFKIEINVHGDTAFLYFECIDIGNFATSPIVTSVLFNAGTVRKIDDKWVFSQMAGGPALPLSVDHFYFP
jgi:ketosteroid isomerase-like protein